METYVVGFILGLLAGYASLILVKLLRTKSGVDYAKYMALPLLTKLKDVLRHIVYEYGIKRNNEDFLLNVSFQGTRIMQVMHRAHFPYLARDRESISFGLALYIPTSGLNEIQRQRLDKVLIEEMDNYTKESDPFDYHVIDLGKGIKHGGYLMTKILKDVFDFDLNESKFELQLFSEGSLPYYSRKYNFKLSSN